MFLKHSVKKDENFFSVCVKKVIFILCLFGNLIIFIYFIINNRLYIYSIKAPFNFFQSFQNSLMRRKELFFMRALYLFVRKGTFLFPDRGKTTGNQYQSSNF